MQCYIKAKGALRMTTLSYRVSNNLNNIGCAKGTNLFHEKKNHL